MVKSGEVRGLFTSTEAIALCRWPVAKEYVEYGDEIRPDPDAGEPRWTAPLSDPNLFLSLAKLGGRGDDLPEAAILRWVRRRGLFDRLDEGSRHPYTETGELNQRPMTFGAFRGEARRAYRILTLLEDVRSRRFDELRTRIGREPGGGEWARLSLDGEPVAGTEGPTPGPSLAVSELPDKQLLSVAEIALTSAVSERLRGVEPTFFPDFSQPRPPYADYSPRLAFCAPDLRTAVWYQLAALIDRKRPLRNCEVCGTPFPLTKKNRLTCSDACRKAKSRRN
ncbi:MAG: hypothetical protein M3P51_01835 [Chloroflexota bacterium]|nr:hypothetical protein [Chloroflexota bacterium]